MKWFRSARARNIPISGVLLQGKVGESLGLETFKASNGWLEKFRTRHNISLKHICGEEKFLHPNEVTDWMGKLKSLLKGYDVRNNFNADETGLLHRVLPDKTLYFKGEKCSGGKISKERFTLLLCCNMLGDFDTPVVIQKAKMPTCSKNIDVRKLSVSWKSNNKAWMTTEIMSDCVEEYVKIDDDLSIEEENLHVSNFIHRDATEALSLSDDDSAESPIEDCKIKDYSEALKYSEQLQQFFRNNEDSE
ncbi:Tigger transposable element-derived protein 6 [Araneus ventricosus]|uniref:Tigger transposable element-derived protein 6 n=1 Tax=Araneus ventricosus TaxID=182803 RepID=A0A4Y2KC67_ARAVE|nr:Tigger transposable element-derived protein 6 [Araneus ventricosus]